MKLVWIDLVLSTDFLVDGFSSLDLADPVGGGVSTARLAGDALTAVVEAETRGVCGLSGC